MRGLDFQRVHQAVKVIDIGLFAVADVGGVRIAVPDHVVRDYAKMFRVGGDIAAVGLGVASGAVQQEQRKPGARLEHACTDAAGIVEGLLQGDTLKFVPYR